LRCRSAGSYDTEHLNTPRLVADSTGTAVWRWDQQEPFGDSPPDENPSALGIFEYPGRFPGQYADRETGLNHNYFRDYNPALPIFLQSDPLGLRAGLNTYPYVRGNPLSLTDPLGLEPGDLQQRGYPLPQARSSCGADDGRRFPSNFGGWSFEQACRNHDNCYSICRKPKGDCDIEFLGDMQKECTRIPIWLAIIARQGQACRATATEYYLAVLIRGGDAYNKAQATCKGCQ
jgi:RHS repeat-associated protein